MGVIALVPADEMFEPYFDRGHRLKTQIAAAGFDIRESMGDIPRLHRGEDQRSLEAKPFFQRGDEIGQFLRPAIAQIVNRMRRLTGRRKARTVPCTMSSMYVKSRHISP